MRIEHIISTMRRSDFSFLKKLKMETDCLVVNQKTDEGNSSYNISDTITARIINTSESGLSRSRNKLLENATGELCIIGDDDVEYLHGYIGFIENAYKEIPDADIIVFRFTHEKERETRARYFKIKRLRMWNISKAASVEITFKRKSIKDAGISFNHNIGLGTDFPSGEENAFLADALRAGLRIYHYPKTICYAVEEHTLRDSDQTKSYLITKGAAFHCIYKRMFLPYAMAFILLKKRSLFKSVSICNALKSMIKGKREYLKLSEV